MLIVAIGGSVNRAPWGEQLRALVPPDTLMTRSLPGAFLSPGFNSKGLILDALKGQHYPLGLRPTNHVALAPPKLIDEIRQFRPGRALSSYLSELESSETRNGWKHIGPGLSMSSTVSDYLFSIPIDERNPMIFCLYELQTWSASRRLGHSMNESGKVITDKWLELIGAPMVPFEPQMRLEIEKRAPAQFRELLLIRREIAAVKGKKARETEDEDTNGLTEEAPSSG